MMHYMALFCMHGIYRGVVMPCRASVQKRMRCGNAKFVVRRLGSLCEEDSVEAVNRTGELFPRGSLQRLAVRRLFSFVHEPACHGRFFTARLCKQVVRKLVREGRMNPPLDPQDSVADWIAKQAKRLQYICKRSKRSSSLPQLDQLGAVEKKRSSHVGHGQYGNAAAHV